MINKQKEYTINISKASKTAEATVTYSHGAYDIDTDISNYPHINKIVEMPHQNSITCWEYFHIGSSR